MTLIRAARPTDAEDMAELQNAIHRAGLRTSPVDVALIRERYLDLEYRVACTVAEQMGRVVGFQSLKLAWPGNPYGVEEGWGIIGTHIHPDAGRSGLGRRLFAASLEAAKAVGLKHVDASIGVDNSPALAYYSALGFTPYREGSDAIPHLTWEVPFDTSCRRVRAPTRIHRVSMLARVDTTRRQHRCLAVHAVT